MKRKYQIVTSWVFITGLLGCCRAGDSDSGTITLEAQPTIVATNQIVTLKATVLKKDKSAASGVSVTFNPGGKAVTDSTGAAKISNISWTSVGQKPCTASAGVDYNPNPASTTVDVYKADFVAVSDEPQSPDTGLTDNRNGTVTITVEGIADPSVLSFSFLATPVAQGRLINKKGTKISFISTQKALVWRTSETYWYGSLPDKSCEGDRNAYRFVLTVNGNYIVSKEYPMVWPFEAPLMVPSVSDQSLTKIHEPEPVPGIANWYRCLIEFGDFTKSAQIIGLPTSDQYSDETAKEESFHVSQWKGEVPDDKGGQSDCFTAKGIKWWINWVGTGPWYVFGHTADEAKALAMEKVITAEFKEDKISWDIFKADRGYMELKAKEHAGYNAAFTYHCMYESTYGPNPVNHHHPAY